MGLAEDLMMSCLPSWDRTTLSLDSPREYRGRLTEVVMPSYSMLPFYDDAPPSSSSPRRKATTRRFAEPTPRWRGKWILT